MARRITYGFFLILFLSDCNKKTEEVRPCSDISYKKLYALIGSNNGKVSYSHYVLINGYSGRCFNYTNFYKIAEGYLDSCRIDLPVSEVYLLKFGEGMGFEENEPEMEKILREGMIMGFGVSSGKIDAVEIVQSGVVKRIYISNCNWIENK